MQNIQSDLYVLEYVHIKPAWSYTENIIELQSCARTVLVPLTNEEKEGLPKKAGNVVPVQLWWDLAEKDCVDLPYIESHSVGPDNVEVKEKVLFISVKKYQPQ
jgi:hypothetical protein